MWNFIKNLFKKKEVPTIPAKAPLPEIPSGQDLSNFDAAVKYTLLNEGVLSDKSDSEILNLIEIKNEYQSQLETEVNHALQNKHRYQDVSSKTGVPWEAIKAIHYREASNDFGTCLHNGDPLPGPTKHVPKGRGPFNSWEDAAVDALLIEKSKFPNKWDMAGTLNFLEKYNGLGYRNRGMASPYLYAGTTAYTSGLFVDDGVLDKSKVDHRLGCAVILKKLTLKDA